MLPANLGHPGVKPGRQFAEFFHVVVVGFAALKLFFQFGRILPVLLPQHALLLSTAHFLADGTSAFFGFRAAVFTHLIEFYF